MTTGSTALRDRSADRLYPIVLVVWLGSLLCFSAFFYLATEDYELVVATRLIGQGVAVGKSTGWPYMPLVPYIVYPFSLLFGENILAFRILTVCLMLSSIFPIYWVLRSLCPPLLSFALTWFSFSLTTFPHPRLEYYFEGAFLAFAIYFAVKFIKTNKRRHIFWCAVFLFTAFASRGFPNVAILVGILPLGLAAVQVLFGPQVLLSTPRIVSQIQQKYGRVIGFLLFSCCVGFLIAFMKKTVHNTFFYEYAGLISPGDFGPVKQVRGLFGIVLPAAFVVIYLLVRTMVPRIGLETQEIGDCREGGRETEIYRLLWPFAVCALIFLICGIIVYPLRDLLFFLFPLDILLDHGRQLSSGRSYIIPLFFCFSLFLLSMWSTRQPVSKKSRIALFLVFLLPATFARFFPTYNMLYLVSFLVAVFACVMLPYFTQVYFKGKTSVVASLQWTFAIFFILYAAVSNFMLLMNTQISDLRRDKLVRIERSPVKGLFIAKDIADFFLAVNNALAKFAGPDEKVAFMSNRYLNYVPLIYARRDLFAGQNLIIGLGRLSSYDDIFDRQGVRSQSRFEPGEVAYNWRKLAQRYLSNARVVVMSLYDPEITKQRLQTSSDPLREYLRHGYSIVDIIEPAMKIHRRSAFPEGAVILMKR